MILELVLELQIKQMEIGTTLLIEYTLPIQIATYLLMSLHHCAIGGHKNIIY